MTSMSRTRQRGAWFAGPLGVALLLALGAGAAWAQSSGDEQDPPPTEAPAVAEDPDDALNKALDSRRNDGHHPGAGPHVAHLIPIVGSGQVEFRRFTPGRRPDTRSEKRYSRPNPVGCGAQQNGRTGHPGGCE